MKKILYISIFGISLLTSCRKEEIDKTDGPSLADLNGAFSVITDLQASKDSVDFAAGETVFFTAEIAKTTPWKLRVVGMTSSAEKIITGTSKIIDVSQTLWNGSTTNLPLFKTEICKVELTFPGLPDTLSTTVKVIQPKVNQGFLISDFESGFNPGWTTFVQSGADMDFQIKSDVTAPEGNSYYNVAGTVDWDWLIGLINFKATAYSGATVLPLTSNPNSLYFNVMVYGEIGLTNSLILFQFQEDEDASGTFDAATEDLYSHQITIDWVGWKLVSIKYTDIPCLVNGSPAAPNGNGQHNSDKIGQINMLHLANPISGFAKSKLDYIIFTENGPLNP